MRHLHRSACVLAAMLGLKSHAALVGGSNSERVFGPRTSYNATCDAIAAAFEDSSVSRVFWPGSQNYTSDIAHNNQALVKLSACSVEPGTPEDVGTVLRIIGNYGTPFAVKSGGHTMNPGFSSTPGVQMSLARFDAVVYDAARQTVRVGPAQVWDAVYAALAPYNVSVVGGRNPGVGVGGLLTGGGYSYKTNQVGLGIDNIVSMEAVLPDGSVVDVTPEASPDLWFALRGAGNNFGIVTNFVLKAYPQSAVWGGIFVYAEDQIPAIVNATAKFYAETTDPKAELLTLFGSTTGLPGLIAMVQLFYDSPEPPAGLFDDLLAIPSLSGSASTQSLVSYFAQFTDTPEPRELYESVPVVNYTAPMLQAMVEEANRTVIALTPANTSFVGFLAEVFLPSIVSHAPPVSGYPASAYPAQRRVALMPGDISVVWANPDADQLVHDTVVEAALRLRRTAVVLGQTEADPDSPDSSMYPNYAAWGTPVERIYGRNLMLLKEVKRKYDPDDVMGLAGGFKITY